MSAQDYDDTDMTAEDFEREMAEGAPADVSNAGGRVAAEGGSQWRGVVTASTAVTRSEDVRLTGTQDRTIKGHLELAGT